MKTKTGSMSWSDGSFKSGGGSKSKDGWMKFKTGSNPIRVLTEPYQYFKHKFKFDGEKGYGNWIPCSADGNCPVCQKGDKAKKRWYLGVIDRTSNSYKIMDVSWAILSDIQTYADDDDWGDPSQYDFDIVVNPNGGPQNWYKTVAKPKRPLSANDLLIKERDVDLEYLESKCVSPDASKVLEIFKGLEAEANKGKTTTDEPVSFEEESGDSSQDFPDSDAASREIPF